MIERLITSCPKELDLTSDVYAQLMYETGSGIGVNP